MKKSILLLIVILSSPLILIAAEKNKGEFGNLVCFLRFADEDETIFDRPITEYETMFNNEASGANSVYNYFKEASYNQLFWKSRFFPLPNETQILSYQARNERSYYKAKGETVNTDGYQNDLEKTSREQGLIKELVEYLSKSLPEDMNIDVNKDNFVDNLCIVVSGYSELSSKYLLWPHRSALTLQNVPLVNGKKVAEYLMVFDDTNGWSDTKVNTGVLCHEMSHTLGTYDLYHTQGDLNPVGVWDLMSDNLSTPQQMSAYTKFKYCKWIDEIPEISQPGTYTLNPVGGSSKENIAYKIKPTGSDQYFVLEYRKKEGAFDKGIPSSGLLVYRINPNYLGNVNYNGSTKFDEQYLFRPGGTPTADGDITKAAFSKESGRTGFGGTNAFKPFYTDGSLARFAITNVSDCGATLSFDLQEIVPQIYLPQPEVNLPGMAASSTLVKVQSDVAWKITNLPDWLKAEPMQGEAGDFSLTLTALTANETANHRTGEVSFVGSANASVTATATVSQSSNIIQPPYNLSGVATEDGIRLTWSAPKEGSPLLTEDFENQDDHHGWTLQNSGERGWQWRQADKYKKAFEGTGFAYMLEVLFDEYHQDERLISPTFSKGTSLSFQSSSIAPGKVQPIPDFYLVEVSKDNGDTWTPIWDLKKQGTVTNQYEPVDIDLSEYSSPTMKVAFHAFDTSNNGLSYWWSIDNVNIYGQPEHSIVSGYEVYRDGIKIGTTTDTHFVDEQPNADADNVYTVKATGSFGITPPSAPASVGPTGIVTQDAASSIQLSAVNDRLEIQSENVLSEAVIYSATGMRVRQAKIQDRQGSVSLQGMTQGIYIIQLFGADGDKPITLKFYRG